MTFVINGTTGATQSASFDSASTFGFKNRIINGAMMIDQRNAGASVTGSSSVDVFPVDRWSVPCAVSSKLTAQQNAGSVTPPAGLTNYLGITSSSAYSVASTDYFFLQQKVEGFNVADLDFGKSTAAPITISFWVRSSLTGTFGGSITNGSFNRSYPFSYTINAANTWEQKSVTIAGDTSGTWLTNNGIGLWLRLCLGSGSTRLATAGSWQAGNYDGATGATSVVGTNGATFYITGVQLEKGSTATSFDYRPYGTELALCQRYYQKLGLTADAAVGAGLSTTSTAGLAYIKFATTMRTSPTVNQSSLGFTDNATYTGTVSGISMANVGTDSGRIFVTTNAVMTANRAGTLNSQGSSGYLELSAEL